MSSEGPFRFNEGMSDLNEKKIKYLFDQRPLYTKEDSYKSNEAVQAIFE